MDELQHAIEDFGLKGVKFGAIYNGVALSDPRLVPGYEYLQKNNILLTMHMGTTFARNAPIAMGRAIHVEPVALKYPDLVMVLAQMGSPTRSSSERIFRSPGWTSLSMDCSVSTTSSRAPDCTG
jgi:uncharacterized protein